MLVEWVTSTNIVLLDQCICKDDEISHDGCCGDFRGFPGGAHSFVCISQIFVEADGYEGRHIERPADTRLATTNESATCPCAGLARNGRYGASFVSAEIGHLCSAEESNDDR